MALCRVASAFAFAMLGSFSYHVSRSLENLLLAFSALRSAGYFCESALLGSLASRASALWILLSTAEGIFVVKRGARMWGG